MIIHKLQLKIFDQTLQRSVVFRIDGLRCLQEGFAMLLDRLGHRFAPGAD